MKTVRCGLSKIITQTHIQDSWSPTLPPEMSTACCSLQNRATPRATSVSRVHTCAVPDISGLQAQRSAAHCETVSPLPTAPPPGFKKLLRIVIPGDYNTEKKKACTAIHYSCVLWWIARKNFHFLPF